MVTLGSLARPVVPDVVGAVVVAAVLAVIAGQELGLYQLPLPQNARQVPQSILAEGGRVGGLQFGFELGTGVRTFMTSGLPHVLLVAVFLFTGWPHALLAGVSFGAGRAWMALSRLWNSDTEAWDDELASRDRLIRVVLTAVSAAVLGLILWDALSGPL